MKSSLIGVHIRLFSWWLLVLIILLPGCSSTTIMSRRLAAKAEPKKEFGIIYQMTKPQFTIGTIQPTDTTTAPKYTLNVQFVPDPERRFAVSANPRTFNESDLTVSLNSNGAMTDLTHTSREQVTPTIKAIGDFTTSIISAAATVAAVIMLGEDPESQAAENMQKELLKRMKVYTQEQDIKKPKSEKDLTQDTPDLDALIENWSQLTLEEKEKHKPALNQRLWDAAKEIHKRLNALPNNYKADHLAFALKPKDPSQVNVLKALAKPTKKGKDQKSAQEKAKEAFEQQLKKLEVSFPPPGLLNWERKLVEGEVKYAVKKEDLITLIGYSQRVVADAPEGSEAAKIPKHERDNLMKQAADLATKGRIFVLSSTSFPNLLGPLIKDKTPAQHIYERVKDLQVQIFKQRTLLANETDKEKRKAYRDTIKNLTSNLHEIIGAADEDAEILKLQEIIKKGPPKALDAAHSSPLQEYAAARAQLAALNEAVTLKLGKVTADAADTPPAKQPEWNPSPVETAFCWNVGREAMEEKTEPPRRILVPKEAKGPSPADRVAARVAMQKEYGADINSWPKYVVVIEEVKP
jgi:hypothetical protein